MHWHASLQVSTPELLVTQNVHSCDHGLRKVLALKTYFELMFWKATSRGTGPGGPHAFLAHEDGSTDCPKNLE